MAEKTTAFTGPVVVGLNDKKGEIRLTDGKNVNEAKYLSIAAPATITSDTTLTFPNGAGNPGQILSTDGSGNLSWVNDSAGNPAGTNGQVQTNDGGVFGAISEGTSGQVLTSRGAGLAPTFQTATGADPVTSSLDINSPKTIRLNADYGLGTGSNNTVMGGNSFTTNPTGGQNTIIGSDAGNNATLGSGSRTTIVGANSGGGAGSSNTIVGAEVLQSNVYGDNTVVGTQAATNGTLTQKTTIVGYQAAENSNQNSDNTYVGYQSGRNISNGNRNTAVGSETLINNTSNNENTAIGYRALNSHNSGQQNTAVGAYAYSQGTSGAGSAGVGYRALYNNTGNFNTGMGTEALFSNTSGFENTAVGHNAGNNVTGNRNTFVGKSAGYNLNSGTNNTIIGRFATSSAGTVSNEITLGDSAIATLRCNQTSITALSDARDKKDIEDANIGLDFINDLRPVKFVWDTRDGARKDIKEVGFIAQELDEVQQKHGVEDHLQLVLKNNPDKLEAAPGKLIPILVQAIKDLKKELDELKKA
tara:strand:+ start:7660 stop:9249 length:1590 start_codon:yes stop_codon:yes gene_type:complete